MGRFTWSRLNSHQVGRFAEYFVKMEFALYGFEIFTSEVDDRGIDFVVRHGQSPFYEIQVKSVRTSNYVFMQKSKFPLAAGTGDLLYRTDVARRNKVEIQAHTD